MFRVNYRPPEALPPHQRDFPPRAARELPGAEGSHQLAFLVASYVAALIAGIVLLGQLTPSTIPATASTQVVVAR